MSISSMTVTASSMVKKSLGKRASLARGIAAVFVGGALMTATVSQVQAQIIWSGGSTEWTTGSNWVGGVPAGSDITAANTDIALFSNNTNTTVGINMSFTSGVYYLGAIEKTNVNARTINNNSTTPGILTLNGATVNSVANTILSNTTANLLTITNGATTGTLGLELGNATDNIIQITNAGGITINSAISGAGRNLTKQGSGAGVLTLAGANTYSGATTISGGVLAASNNALGDGSITNTLVFNGGTLRATGAITSPSTRGVTLTSTGIIDNNGFAVSIAGDMAGAGGLVKNGSGTLTLSGTNNYAGVTRVNGGTLLLTSQAALYNSNPGSWTAANINVKAGSTFAVNVDSAGTAGFTAANLATLLGNISVANNVSSGLQAGSTVGIDTSTATGGTFSLNTPLTNSTGAFGGTIGLTKYGAGTLVLDLANTYTGPTAILGGTLQLDSAGTISTAPLLINGSFVVNKSGALTQGTNFPSLLNGNGALDYNGGGTLTLNTPNLFYGSTTASSGTIALTNARALQNSTLVTTGGGVISLVGPTTLTLGGLSGASGDLSTTGIFSASYGTLTRLTLNTRPGTVTYGGVITNGAAGMTLTKTGAGTQVLQGVNTYSGATNINANNLSTSNGNSSILELSGSGSILNSAVTLNGGELRLTNTAAETGSGRVNDTAPITVVSGTISYNNTDNAEVYAETIGSVALTVGHLNIVQSVDQIGGGSQTLTLAGLTRTGAANVSTIAFSAPALTGLNATTNRIQVNGAAATPAGQIIGAWATTGTAANLQTDYAVYDGSGNVVPANILPSAETTWTSATDAYTSDSSVSLTANRTIAALRNTGTSATITLSDGTSGYTLATNGILSANNSVLVIAAGSPEGQITAPGTSGGQIYINTGGSKPWALTANNNNIDPNGYAINITAPINDNGGAVTVVKAGENSVLRLAGANNYSGGTVINSGILIVNGDAALGASTGDITLNGGQLRFGANNLSFNADRDVIVGPAGGSIAPIGNQTTINFNGKLTGAGTLAMGNTAGAGGRNAFFNSTDNDFTGEVSIPSLSSIFRVNSFVDTVGAGDIILYKGTARSDQASFEYGTGAIAPLTLNNRSIQIVNDTGTTFSAAIVSNLNTSQPITVNTDLISIGATARTLQLNAAAGPVNVFAGKITDGSGGGILNLTKTGAGTWTLSGNNSFSGGVTLNGASVGSQLNINSTTALGTGTFTISGGNNAKFDNTSGNPLTLSTNNGQSWLNDFEFVGSNDLNLGIGNVTLGGNRNLNITASTLTVGGAISGGFGITKNGAGTLVLGGANDYSGTTTVNVGKLLINGNSSAATGPVNVNASAILGGSGIVGGLTTVNSGFVAPGNSAGNLTFANGLDLASSGVYTWELGALSTANPGTNFDLITVSGGNLALGGASTLTLDFGLIPATDPNSADAFWTSNQIWKIIDVTGGTNTGDTNLSTITNANYASGNFTTTVGTGADLGDIFLVFTSNTVAGTSIWQGANNDPWTAASSWNGSVPNSASAEARFETTGGTTAILDANQTVNKLTFDATAPHTISGANTLSLAGTTPTISLAGTNTATHTVAVNLDLAAGTSVSVQGGTLELNSPANAVLGAGVTATVASGATLSLGGTGNALSNGTSTHANVANSGTLAATTAGKRVGEISGSGTTTVTTAGATLTANHIRQATLNIGAGNTVTVAANGGNSGTSVVTNLNINATGKLDLNDNDLVVDNGNLATLTAQLATGLDINGTYGNGPGITSTAFANNVDFNTVLGIAANVELGYTSFSGQTVDANDVLIKYTYYGDADLSGSVDTSTDFDLYITGLTSGGSLGGWLFGDFDYSGTVDSSTDFDLYITGLTSQGSPLLTAGGGNQVQAVPEPSTFVLGGLALIGFAGVGLRRRRLAQQQA